MDDSIQSDTIQFAESAESNRSPRSEISHHSQSYAEDIFHLLRTEIRDTFKIITEENAFHLAIMQETFQKNKFSNLKDYIKQQVLNIFQEMKCIRAKHNDDLENKFYDSAEMQNITPVVNQPAPR